jgi:hypothetical protein
MRCSSALLVLLAAAVGCGACTNLASSDLKTAGMSATMTVTLATVQINVDDNITDIVTLSPGDTLFATAGSDTQTMSESDDLLNDVSYVATFSGESAPGTLYTVAFRRNQDQSAPRSSCTLPAPFSITAPSPSATFSRAGDDITVTYGGAGSSDAIRYSVSGDCVASAYEAVPSDTGTLVIPRGTLALTNGAGASNGGTCQATLTLTRSRSGSVDPAFGAGGEMECQQTRTVTFASAP